MFLVSEGIYGFNMSMARTSPEKQSRSQQKVHLGLAAGWSPRQTLVRLGKATLEELAKQRVLGTNFGKSDHCTTYFTGAAAPAEVQELLKRRQLFCVYELISFHLSLGQGRYQVFPGTFIPVENVFTPRVKRTWAIKNYSGNSYFCFPDLAGIQLLKGQEKKVPFPLQCHWQA